MMDLACHGNPIPRRPVIEPSIGGRQNTARRIGRAHAYMFPQAMLSTRQRQGKVLGARRPQCNFPLQYSQPMGLLKTNHLHLR